jgi:hypothetical protein
VIHPRGRAILMSMANEGMGHDQGPPADPRSQPQATVTMIPGPSQRAGTLVTFVMPKWL